MSEELGEEIETHPFDLSFETMSKIRMYFPEYQVKHDPSAGVKHQQEYNVKAPGILLADLKDVLRTHVFITEANLSKMFS